MADLRVLLGLALRSSSAHLRIEVSTLLRRKAEFWCIAPRKPWLHLDLKERKGGREVTFLWSVCWFFIIPIYAVLSRNVPFPFIHSCVILLICLYLQLHPQNLKPISSAYQQHPGRESAECASVENLAFLYLIGSSTEYDYSRDCEMY